MKWKIIRIQILIYMRRKIDENRYENQSRVKHRESNWTYGALNSPLTTCSMKKIDTDYKSVELICFVAVVVVFIVTLFVDVVVVVFEANSTSWHFN